MAPSFDALESVISTPDIKLSPSTQKTPTEAKSAEGSPEKPKTEVTATLPKTEEKAPETKAAKEVKKDIDGNEVKDEGESAEASSETVKELKFKVGPRGKEVALPPDAKVVIPVDGQEVEVTLEDLKANYNGKVVYEKKFSELDKNWKAFSKDKEQTETQLNNILSKAYNKDVLGSILDMADIAQLDPKPVFEHIRDELIGDIEKYVNMTPEQRELHWLKKEIEFMSRDRESLAQRKQAEQTQAELDAAASKLRETLEVSDDWMQKAKTELEANPELAKQYLGDDTKKHGEKVVQLADTLKRQDISVRSLALVKPEFADNMALLNSAVQYLGEQPRSVLNTLTVEAFAQQIADYLGVPMASKVSAQEKVLEEKTKLAKKASETQDDEETPRSSKKSKKTEDEEDPFDPRGWDRL
jgi:hypothetical protein